MVVIVGSAAEAWERKNKRMQKYKNIFVTLRSVSVTIEPRSRLKLECNTDFVRIALFIQIAVKNITFPVSVSVCHTS